MAYAKKSLSGPLLSVLASTIVSVWVCLAGVYCLFWEGKSEVLMTFEWCSSGARKQMVKRGKGVLAEGLRLDIHHFSSNGVRITGVLYCTISFPNLF